MDAIFVIYGGIFLGVVMAATFIHAYATHGWFERRAREREQEIAERTIPPLDNRGTSALGFMGGAKGSSGGRATGSSGADLDKGSDSVDLSQPLSTILYDTGPPSYATPSYSTPERCDSSSFSDSSYSYSCDSGSSSDSGSSGGGE